MELNPYASCLDGQDPIPVLTTTVERLNALAANLSGPEIIARPAPDKWSICEIVSHLADCEIVFSFRLRQALAEEHALIQPFDQDIWAKRYGAYTFEAALTLFTALRNWNLLYLTTVSQDDRHHPTTHPERGTMTFWTIVETMAGHDINHLQRLEAMAADHQP
jgi:DinB superfamily